MQQFSSMNAKCAILRLFVAVTGLVASFFELAGALVRLATACLERLARCTRGTTMAHGTPTGAVPVAAPVAIPRVTLAMTGDERLTAALLSLKFPTAKVRLFTASVAGRQEPLEVLVKEGILALSVTN